MQLSTKLQLPTPTTNTLFNISQAFGQPITQLPSSRTNFNAFSLKQQSAQKQPQILEKDMNTERKKASQILHYLMERKQEFTYEDPFELLRNMNDVLYNYGEHIVPASIQVDEKLEKQTLDQSKANNTSIQEQGCEDYLENSHYQNTLTLKSNKFSRIMLGSTAKQSQGLSHISSKQFPNQLGSSFYSNNNNNNTRQNTFSNKKGSLINDNCVSIQNDQSFYNERNLSTDKSSFPDINSNKSQIKFEVNNSTNKADQFQRTQRIKHILDKQKERILNTNIPEVTKMFDGLDHKYNRIMKLKEEFQDIKNQFTQASNLLQNNQKRQTSLHIQNSQSVSFPLGENEFNKGSKKSQTSSPNKDLKESSLIYQGTNLDTIDEVINANQTNKQSATNLNTYSVDQSIRTQSQPKQRLQRLLQKQQIMNSVQYQQSTQNQKAFKINIFNHTSRSLEKDQLIQRRDKLLQNQRVKLALKQQSIPLQEAQENFQNTSINDENQVKLTLNKRLIGSKESDSLKPNQNIYQRNFGMQPPSSKMLQQLSFRKQFTQPDKSCLSQLETSREDTLINHQDEDEKTQTNDRKFVRSQLQSTYLQQQQNSGQITQGYVTLYKLKNVEKLKNHTLIRLNKLYPHANMLNDHISPSLERFKHSDSKKITLQNEESQIESAQINFDEETNRFNVLPKDYSQISLSRQHTQDTKSHLDQSSFDKRKEKENFLKQTYGEQLSQRNYVLNNKQSSLVDKDQQQQIGKQNEPQQHAGVALYERFVAEQQKQIKLIQKQKKKMKKQQAKLEKKQSQTNSVENIYLREVGSAGIVNLATSQGSGYFQKGGYFGSKKHSKRLSNIASRSVSQNSNKHNESIDRKRSQKIMADILNKSQDERMSQDLDNKDQTFSHDNYLIDTQNLKLVELTQSTNDNRDQGPNLQNIQFNVKEVQVSPSPMKIIQKDPSFEVLSQKFHINSNKFKNDSLISSPSKEQTQQNISQKIQEMKKKIEQMQKTKDQNQPLFKLSKYEEPKEDTPIEQLLMNSSIFQLSNKIQYIDESKFNKDHQQVISGSVEL